MKILAVSADYPPRVGGIAAHVYELYQAIAAQNHEVRLLTSRASAIRAYDNQVRLLPLPRRIVRPLYGYQINAAINKLCAQWQPDIIHLHGILPLHKLNAKPAPIVFTNHSSGYLQRLNKGSRALTRLENLFAPIDLLLAPSEELLHTPFACNARKAFIANGVEAARFTRNENTRTQLRHALAIKDDELLAIITRRLVPKNGVLDLARATQHIHHPKLKFLLIGDGTEHDAIKRTFEKHFSGRYIMAGAMTHEQIVPYYSAADFSILPSHMEATSISCLEAMAAGLPIIATRVGGLPSLVQDGTHGILCEPHNPRDLAAAIDRLAAHDSAALAALGAAALARVHAHFTWEKIAAQTINAYKQSA